LLPHFAKLFFRIIAGSDFHQRHEPTKAGDTQISAGLVDQRESAFAAGGRLCAFLGRGFNDVLDGAHGAIHFYFA
jgi:hypothetical protein